MEKIAKRIFDFLLSLLGLIVLCPLFLLIAIAIKMDSPGPVFFRQERVGKNGKIFRIYKFRTMVENAEKIGINYATAKDDPRITKIGKILRKYKIDELPQLINVCEGTMSFVGPRPEVKKIVDLYSDEQRRILQIKPGITDFASLQFKDENDMISSTDDIYDIYVNEIIPEKLRLNLEYLEKQSLWLDFRLICRTVANIVLDSIK